MPFRSFADRIQGMLNEVIEVQQLVEGMSFEDFCQDRRTLKAVLYSLAVIGEATANVLPEVQTAYPQVPWVDIRGMRNVTIHEYFQLDLEIVWATISLFSKDWDSSLIKLSKVIEDSRYGPRFSSSLYNEKGSVGQIRTTDMDEGGNINYSTVPKADLIAEDYKEHLLKNGDIVISRSGTCGITAIFNSQKIPVIPGAFLIRLRPNEKTSSEYLHEFFSSLLGRQLTASLARGGVQKNISGSQLLEQEVPCPIQERQKEVVSKLDGLKKAERNLQKRQLMLQRMKTKFLNTALGGFT